MQFNDFLLATPKLKVILKSKEILVDKINFAPCPCHPHPPLAIFLRYCQGVVGLWFKKIFRFEKFF